MEAQRLPSPSALEVPIFDSPIRASVRKVGSGEGRAPALAEQGKQGGAVEPLPLGDFACLPAELLFQFYHQAEGSPSSFASPLSEGIGGGLEWRRWRG